MGDFNFLTFLVFIGSIGIEAALTFKENRDHYDMRDTRINFTIGLIGLLVNMAVKSVIVTFFLWLQPYAIFNAGTGVLAWVVLFFLADFQSYLFHYMGHRVRFFWAMHVIHHSSPKFNFTTAFRTPFTNSLFRMGTMAPLVLLGFHPWMVIWMDLLIISFAFFQHTQMIGKLGWLEYIFSTPSHHRVHHASDEKYIDKNFGGILIIWDKIFGTFQEEETAPTFGLTKPLKKQQVFHVIFHEWMDIVKDSLQAKSWNERWCYLFAAPGWKPDRAALQRSGCILYISAHHLKNAFIVTTMLGLSFLVASAQSAEEFFSRGLKHDLQNNDQAALLFYQKTLKANPDHVEALWRCSRQYSKLSGRHTDRKQKQQSAQNAKYHAERAMQLDPQHTDARLSYIIALGLLSEVADNPSEKIRHARVIKTEADAILALDSLFAPAYYVLGKWHYEIARLNWAERLACNLLFGGVPKEASFERSIACFERAIQLKPDYILFHYAKARALVQCGQYQRAVKILEAAVLIPPQEPDDQLRMSKCRKLLNETRQIMSRS